MNGRGPALSLWEPAAGKDPARLQTAPREATPRAVGAAPEAQSERARTPPRTRDKTRFRAATKLDRRREELPRQITHEMERCAPKAVEVDKTIFFFRFMTGEGARLAGEPRPSLGPSPRGRRRAKSSWRRGLDHGLELPSRHSVRKIATALVAGNASVFKPALQTTGTGAPHARARCAAGMPAAVLNVVAGAGTAEALTRHPDVRVLTFTGSTGVGRTARRVCGCVRRTDRPRARRQERSRRARGRRSRGRMVFVNAATVEAETCLRCQVERQRIQRHRDRGA